jgi:hypothetical protein
MSHAQDAWPIVDVVADILEPATDQLRGASVAGHELVVEDRGPRRQIIPDPRPQP